MSEDQAEGRILTCNQCHKTIGWTTNAEMVAYCDIVCDNSHVCEESAESKDEMLQAIGYAENREDLEA